MSEHYRLSPSSSKRWLVCPGSALPNLPESTNPAAEAGTVAHELAQTFLESGYHPIEAMALEHAIYEKAQPIFGGRKKADAIRVARAASAYADLVVSQGGVASFEHKIKHATIEDFGGTVDCAIQSDGPLTIIDLKTGKWGVQAANNPQLQCYAILARQIFETDDVVACIVQPHTPDVDKVAVYSKQQLDDFEGRVAEAAVSDKRVASEDGCRFCPVKENCPERIAAGL